MNSAQKIAVAGATGRVGRHVVDLLKGSGHEVVSISRSNGVDVITGEGLDEALRGVDVVVDAATGPSPDKDAATKFFTTSAGNLQRAGERADVGRIVAVSIIGCDRFTDGYNVGKAAHERELQSGPVPVRLLRAAQFHEFVGQFLDWTTQGEVAYVPVMRTQLVAARTVAEELAELATGPEPEAGAPIPEIAGPRVERFAEVARLLAATRETPERVSEQSNSEDPDRDLFAGDGLLPGPHAKLAGPTFEEWLTQR